MFQVLMANLGLDPERVQPTQMCVPTLTWNTQMRAPTKVNRFNRMNEKKIETPGNCDLSFILNLVILGPSKWIFFFLIFSKIWDVFRRCIYSSVCTQRSISKSPMSQSQRLNCCTMKNNAFMRCRGNAVFLISRKTHVPLCILEICHRALWCNW